MLKGFGSLFGFRNSDENELQETKVVQMPDCDGQIQQNELNVEDDVNEQEFDQKVIQERQGLGGFLLSLASNATRKLSDTVTVKAGSIIDKTIIGAFNKEHMKFLQEKHTQTDEAVPPWVGCSDEDAIQQLILALSLDRRNFICDPAGDQFHFDFKEMYPVALVMLQQDELLSQMRFVLVPKHVKEERFWRNYFYRVSLIKQSAQLKSLATEQQAADEKKSETDVISPDDVHITERKSATPPITETTLKTIEVEDELSSTPDVSEFVSDAFDDSSINPDDLRKEMRLALDEDENTADGT